MKITETLSMEDWIILRLLRVAVDNGGRGSFDVAMAALYLDKKYDTAHLFDCIDQLERAGS